MRVLEELVRSKSGRQEDCEDGFVVTPHYACVVDGATSCTGRKWTRSNWTGGQWASRIICDAVPRLAPDAEPTDIISVLTSCLATAYHDEGVWQTMKEQPQERATASIVLYSRPRNEIIMVGDCQAAIVDKNGRISQTYQPTKFVDKVTSQARAMFLQTELLSGKNTTELLEMDTGRDFIQELLARQRFFQNNPEANAPFQYWVMDGFPLKNEGIIRHSIPSNTTELILATDGFPKIFPTLTETESHMKNVLGNDPLLISQWLGTKDLQKEAESYDDRTYLRLRLG